MKQILLFPPFWDITNIHIAYPILSAQLKAHGFDSKIIDLNIKFFNNVLSKSYLSKALLKIKEDWEMFSQLKEMPKDKFLIKRYQELKKFYEEEYNLTANISDEIENNINTIKTAENDCDNEEMKVAINNLHIAINIILLYYSYFSVFLPKEFMGYEDVKNLALHSKYNFFYDYYKEKIDEIASNADIIGINISHSAQIIPALTLAQFFKKRGQIKVVLGGTYITRIYNAIIKHLDFFDIFTDFILYGEGESSIVELAKYINKEIKIEEVPNLIYKLDDKIIVNKQGKNISIYKTVRPDYSDLDLSDYFIKNKILPLQTQRGCYWRKCSFCDISHGLNYCVKRVEDIINEIEYNIIHYGVTNYTIIDESMPPQLLYKISSSIIKNGLKLNFNILSRLEKNYTPKILKKAYEAGLKVSYWGVETGNKRIAKLMNKGISLETMSKVLKASSKAGIKNAIFIIINFPTEKFEEALDTIKFISSNARYIDGIILYEYRLSKYSYMAKNPEKYNITIINDGADFSTTCDFLPKQLTENEKEKIYAMVQDINHKLHISSTVN